MVSSPFQVLEIPEGSSVETAKKAYRRMAHLYHPDKPGGDAKRFIECKNAFEEIEKEVIQPHVNWNYTPRSSSDFWKKYNDIIRDQNEISKALNELLRKRREAMAAQMKETHEEWKKRMRDAADLNKNQQ